MVKWMQLKIITKSSTELGGEISLKTSCGLFKNLIDENSKELDCKHFFHTKCIDTMVLKNGVACVLCRL